MSGVRRKVDELGRVVIPAGMRRELEIEAGDELSVTLEDDRLVMVKVEHRCVLCGSRLHLQLFRDKPVCWSCRAALRHQEVVEAG